jgi:hypothetical protein
MTGGRSAGFRRTSPSQVTLNESGKPGQGERIADDNSKRQIAKEWPDALVEVVAAATNHPELARTVRDLV